MSKYLVEERRIKLMKMLNSSGSLRAKELAQHFGVTTETIRKDLLALEQQNLLQKRHGGAIALYETAERPVSIRSEEHCDAKSRIAEKALSYLHGHMSLMIDSGSTLLRFAQLLPPDLQDLQIITNSFAAAGVLIQKNRPLCFIGGNLCPDTMATSGFLATTTLNMVGADLAFLGSSGFQSFGGPSAKHDTDAQVKSDMIRNARKRIVLADSSKFITNGFVQYAEWHAIDLLITDGDAPEEAVRRMKNKVDVVMV